MHAPGAVRVAVALASASGLAAEIVLMRIFSIVEWHQFAWMIISLALLGFGASGTILALFRRPVLKHASLLVVALPALAGIALLVSLDLALRVEWRSPELLWNPAQSLNLLQIYLLLAVPFCFTGLFIGLALMRWSSSITQLYGADLAGAACGAVAAIALLETASPSSAWTSIASLGILASLAATLGTERRFLLVPIGAGLVMTVLRIVLPFSIEPGEYKTLSQALRVPHARVTTVRSGPLGFLQAYENERVPLRIAPGLSLNYFDPLPPQKGVFIDGEGPIVLNRTTEPLVHIDATTFGVALRVLAGPSRLALVVGLTGLPELVRLHQAGFRVVVVEPNRHLVELVANEPGWGGELLTTAGVTIRHGEIRSVLPHLQKHPDLIFLPLGANLDGSLDPRPNLTTDSFASMIEWLSEDGLLAIRSPVETPPRTTPRLLSSIAVALESSGLDPKRHVAAMRGWDGVVILVTRNELDARRVRAVKEFAEEFSFDLIALPGMKPSDANRFHRLDRPWHYETARSILSGPERREALFASYKFDIEPVTDDRAWFGTAMRWPTLIELLELRGQGGSALIRSGYPILLLSLAQAGLAGLILILLPLSRLGSTGRHVPGRWRIITVFGSLGLGFLFLEIVYIHRLTAILGRPLEATTIVLASFLLFAGLGSMASRSLERSGRSAFERPTTRLLVASITVALLTILELPVLDFADEWLLQLSHGWRVASSILLIAPLAFVMGIPFPSSLEIVRCTGNERWIAWAWGINGCASVVSAILAVLLSVHFGLALVTITASFLYVLAGLALGFSPFDPRSSDEETG